MEKAFPKSKKEEEEKFGPKGVQKRMSMGKRQGNWIKIPEEQYGKGQPKHTTKCSKDWLGTSAS